MVSVYHRTILVPRIGSWSPMQFVRAKIYILNRYIKHGSILHWSRDRLCCLAQKENELFCQQTMLEDKIKATDWEATNEAIEEQVARESYLQWLRDNEMRKAVSYTGSFIRLLGDSDIDSCFFDPKRSASSSSTSTVTSAQHSHTHFHPHGGRGQQRSHTSSPTTTQTSQDTIRNSPKVRLTADYCLSSGT